MIVSLSLVSLAALAVLTQIAKIDDPLLRTLVYVAACSLLIGCLAVLLGNIRGRD